MKKLFKISGIIFLAVIILLIAGYAFISFNYPKVTPATDLKISSTPEMIERGRYLSNSFAGCIDCHSKRDFSLLAGPLIPGTEGMGGEDFGEGAGYIPAKNITPDKETGIGDWTDGEIFRAVTAGIDKKGEPLGPMMPYMFFGKLDKEDVYAIIAYIKTLPPVKNKVPDHKFNFPLNLIFRTLPADPQFGKRPDPNNSIATGEYYSSGCKVCHSPMEKGDFISGKLFSGGVEFPLPKGGIIRSMNITPDKETGIGKWTKEQFIERFKNYLKPKSRQISVHEGEFNSIMPWTFFATAKEEDLGAVYDYLMSQNPVSNKVEKFSLNGIKSEN
jgi:mono/diheme cytochrome c family protein